MINVLYIVQQSVYTPDHKWVTADSNVQMMCGLIKEIISKTNTITFHIVIGKLEDFADINSFSELIPDHPQVIWHEYPFIVDAFLNRQHFDIRTFEMLMIKVPPIDIIWNNITELSRNIKTWMYYTKYPAKLITSCYWMDCPIIGEEKVPWNVSYMWRQFDGFLCSDLATFTCESVRDAFFYNAEKVFHETFSDQIMDKSVIFDFGFSAEELNIDPAVSMASPIIIFPNRLSGINYTHHENFIAAIRILSDHRRNDFHVVFTNPSKKVNPEALQEVTPNYLNYLGKHHQVLSKSEYAQLLNVSSISVHLFDIERYGGCAHREAIYCDCLPITLKLHEYRRIQGEDYPFYLHNLRPETIARTLDQALENLDYVESPAWDKIKVRNFKSSYEHQSDHVIDKLMEVVNE